MSTQTPLTECRLCGSPLQTWEHERSLCTVCEGYAEQLGVRTDAEFDRAIADLLKEPMFQRSQKQVQ